MDLNKTFSAVQYASRKLLALNDEKINQILLAVADAAEKRTDFILAENRKDLERMDISNPKYDRLKLTADRLKGIADDIRKVAKLPSPVGRVQKQAVMPNGLKIKTCKRSFRSNRHHLRSTPQRQFRCILALPKERQCLHTKRRK